MAGLCELAEAERGRLHVVPVQAARGHIRVQSARKRGDGEPSNASGFCIPQGLQAQLQGQVLDD
eukprot:CAMPEP_0197930570 /NCGR_PEP_ID=MMETSP1439-20131203/105688_1 /TAXON_ID=66791 /ORGANISM="Gonyaulax spinifera, Strain CCMP409" /LENGTH=63 /DNA_ID=CAMNT_0043553265 /DNA_START=193 /DNA_END=381 /DNA_ORIENTATION=+